MGRVTVLQEKVKIDIAVLQLVETRLVSQSEQAVLLRHWWWDG